MKKLFLITLGAFIFGVSSTFSQTQDDVRITISVQDTGQVGVSVKSITELWSKMDWNKKGANGEIVISRKVNMADCMMLTPPKSMTISYFYMEKGEKLALELSKTKFTIVGNSLTARQNKLLSSITDIHNEVTAYAQKMMFYKLAQNRGRKTEQPTPISISDLYIKAEKIIDQFAVENKDCSAAFLRYVRLENKYFKIKNSINFPQKVSKTYHPFSQEELNLMATTLEDSKYAESVLSFNYRFVMHAYMDYLRIADPKHYLGNGKDYLMNEIRLCDYVQHPVVKRYLAAINLYDLFYFNRKNEDFEKLAKQYTGEWSTFIIDEGQNYKAKVKIEHPAVDLPQLSGIKTDGSPIKLSDFKGRWLVIDFWATWCGPCRNQIPYFLELQKRCTDLPVAFLGVSVDKADDREKWVKAVSEEKLVGPQMLCTDKASVYSQFAISGIPHFAIIDPNGKLYMNGVPFPTSGVMERLLKDLTKPQ